MKKIYSIITMCILAIAGNAQFDQIQNGGFENWTNTTIFETPTQWHSSNTDEFRGIPLVEKSTDAPEGMYSAILSAAELPNGDTLFGYVFHGLTGNSGPDGGIAYSDNFEAVSVAVKSDLLVDDTLNFIMTRYLNGAIVGFNVEPVAFGTNSVWTDKLMYVGNTVQDSLFIGFVLGDPMNNIRPKPGSWAMIDNVKLISGGLEATPLPNPGFENWITETVENADSWYSLNGMLAGLGLENAIKTLDANTGSYAMEMTTVIMGLDTISSYISVGEIDFNSSLPFQRIPYAGSPTHMSGYYKYSPVNGDEAAYEIAFFDNGNTIGGNYFLFTQQSTYTEFSVPLNISGTPDSIAIVFYSGENPGSVLKLDDLTLSSNADLFEFSSMETTIYPNPALEKVMIKAEGEYDIHILDLNGKSIHDSNNIIGIHEINIKSVEPGTYLIQLTTEKGTETHRLIVK